MKPFHSWIESMTNSIEDGSIIVKDEHGDIVEAPIIAEPEVQSTYSSLYPFLTIRDKIDDLHEKWMKRFDDEPTYVDDEGDYYD